MQLYPSLVCCDVGGSPVMVPFSQNSQNGICRVRVQPPKKKLLSDKRVDAFVFLPEFCQD